MENRMESQSKRYSLRPLPGVRRGVSGANAGCYSMRTVGDGGLSRRVPLEKIATAERSPSPSSTVSSEHSLFGNITSPSSIHSLFRSPDSSPSSSYSSRITRSTAVVREALAIKSAPTVGHLRARKKWTEDMNRFIWRTYLLVTKCETTHMNNYLEILHQEFESRYPEMQATRQRLGDQRRAILRRKLLPQKLLDEIGNEVREYIIQTENHDHTHSTQITAPSQTNTTNNTRMKWSDEINEDIIRFYFEVTELEKNQTGYRKKLYELFIERHPYLSYLTEQRIADQRRLIFKNKKYSNKIHELKREVELKLSELNNRLQPDTDQNYTVIEQTQQSQRESTTDILIPIHHTQLENIIDSTVTVIETSTLSNAQKENSQLQNPIESNKIEIEFNNAIARFSTTDAEARPYIPKQKYSQKFAQIVYYLNNEILPRHLNHDLDFITLHTLIYSAAFTAALCNGTRFNTDENITANNRNRKPTWQRRIESKIEKYRLEIGRLTQYIIGNRNQRILKTVEEIKLKYKTHSQHEESNTEPQHFLDTLKQKLNALSNRLRRYLTCTKRKQQNATFINNERQFYRTLGHDQQINTTRSAQFPSPQHLQQFWAGLWENPIAHNSKADWLDKIADTANIKQMDFKNITVDTFIQIIKRTQNWKAPGTDNIHNYWYKKLTCTHPFIHKHICQFIHSPHDMPTFITNGLTYMLPKGSDPKDPANYRPITCLQTIYKIITGCISEIIYRHLDQQNILAEQQKGSRKNSQGCKEQLTIDTIAMKQAHNKNRNIHIMYIDYKKAFDSVPHSWLIYVLKHYKIHPSLISFLNAAMLQWKTKLKLINNSSLITEPIKIQRGIFQGDALSPLWFCLALNPLSELLNNTNVGFKLKNNNSYHILSHLLYMDDIKIYATNNTELTELADITQSFSTDIKMQFGVDKCKVHSIIRGKSIKNTYILDTGEQIEPMDEHSTYKYLGFHQSKQIHQKQAKLDLTKKFKIRMNQILRTQLNSRNSIKAINTYAIPILTYSFGIINWSQSDLIKLQRTINTHMTVNRKHHPRSCTQRLTLPRQDGGRGIIDIQNLHNNLIDKFRKYFYVKAEHSQLHKYIIDIDKKLTPLNLNDRNFQPKIVSKHQKIDLWSQKSLHGRHFADLGQAHVDRQASNEWLRRGELFPETEAFVIAIQDQVIDTRNYQKHIIRIPNPLTDLCRRCHSSSETIQHITGACKSIVQTDYKHRHDQVAAIIHQNLARKYSFISKKIAYYKYNPSTILESNSVKIYWDRTIITDKTIHYNRPDITILDKIKKLVFIIDIAVCNTHNLITTHSEKMTKYVDLAIEIKRQWQVDSVKIIPIIISTTGVVPKTLQTGLNMLQMPKSTLILIQKAVLLNTCRLTRKFLNSSSSSL